MKCYHTFSLKGVNIFPKKLLFQRPACHFSVITSTLSFNVRWNVFIWLWATRLCLSEFPSTNWQAAIIKLDPKWWSFQRIRTETQLEPKKKSPRVREGRGPEGCSRPYLAPPEGGMSSIQSSIEKWERERKNPAEKDRKSAPRRRIIVNNEFLR
jgi:hypothetical protein